MATPATDQGGMCQHPVTSNIKYEKNLKDQEIRGVQVAEEHHELAHTCSTGICMHLNLCKLRIHLQAA